MPCVGAYNIANKTTLTLEVRVIVFSNQFRAPPPGWRLCLKLAASERYLSSAHYHSTMYVYCINLVLKRQTETVNHSMVLASPNFVGIFFTGAVPKGLTFGY